MLTPVTTMSRRITAKTPLSLMTLNVNNICNSKDKQVAVAHLIEKARPHVLILTETAQKEGESLPVLEDARRRWSARTEYNVYSAPAAPTNISTGVALYVDKTLHATKVEFKKSGATDGRVCVVDIVLPDEAKRRKTIRVIGIYAPTGATRSKGQTTSATLTPFWEGVAGAVSSGPPDWIVGGDYNAHLIPSESHASGNVNYDRVRDQQKAGYRGFLAATLGQDTWEVQGGSCWEHHWTMKAWTNHSTRRVMDRFTVSSTLSVMSTETLHGDGVAADLTPSTLPDVLDVRKRVDQEPAVPVPGTNHRPVRTLLRVGCLVPKTRKGFHSLAPRRLRQPHRQNAADAYAKMNEALAETIKDDPPPTLNPTSPQQCDQLYSWCSAAFLKACKKAFARPRAPAPVNSGVKPVSTPDLEAARDKALQIGRAIRAAKENRFPGLLDADDKVRQLIESSAPHLLGTDFQNDDPLSTLNRLRKAQNTVVRREERRANTVSVVAAERKEWAKAMNGGKLKHLFEPVIVCLLTSTHASRQRQHVRELRHWRPATVR